MVMPVVSGRNPGAFSRKCSSLFISWTWRSTFRKDGGGSQTRAPDRASVRRSKVVSVLIRFHKKSSGQKTVHQHRDSLVLDCLFINRLQAGIERPLVIGPSDGLRKDSGGGEGVGARTKLAG